MTERCMLCGSVTGNKAKWSYNDLRICRACKEDLLLAGVPKAEFSEITSRFDVLEKHHAPPDWRLHTVGRMRRVKRVSSQSRINLENSSQANNFSLRGYRVLLSCPLCLHEILTVEEATSIKTAVQAGNVDFAEAFLVAHDCSLLILIPENIEVTQQLNKRVVLAPICDSHTSLDVDKIEHTIISASLFGRIIKEPEE